MSFERRWDWLPALQARLAEGLDTRGWLHACEAESVGEGVPATLAEAQRFAAPHERYVPPYGSCREMPARNLCGPSPGECPSLVSPAPLAVPSEVYALCESAHDN